MSTRLNTNIGDYHIIDFIGAGGMGEVYRARHTKLDREVAIKFLSFVGKDSTSQERFLREARILSKLQHKNIVTLYDFTSHQDQPCIIMEYVTGITLLQYIHDNGPLSPNEAKAIFETIVEAICYIHENGIIHRDIKSNNIMINHTNEVKLLDFGIAKTNQGTRITETPQIIGTDEYLAPELLRQSEANITTDIWALGILLYEMTTLQLPFQDKERLKLYRKIETSSYVAPSKICLSVTPQIDKIVSRCLQKKPAERYQSARELLADLRQTTKPLVPLSTARPSGQTGNITSAVGVSQPKKTFPIILGAVATLSLVVALYFNWLGATINGTDENTQSSVSTNTNDPEHNRYISVPLEFNVFGAEVFDKDGKCVKKLEENKIYEYKAYLGEVIELTVRKEGYEDRQINLPIKSENTKKSYHYDLVQKE